MRPDMDKVLVLRGRYGGDSTYTKRHRSQLKQLLREEKYEDIPLHEPIKPNKAGWEAYKELNENLTPLERFLEKSVGRNWDDVYSEIRENINPNSAVQYHILQHLEHMVELHVEYDENKVPMIVRRWWGRGWDEIRDGELYVCPNTGILKKHKRKKKQKPQEPPTKYNLLDNLGRKKANEVLEKFDGIWYYVEYGYVEHTGYDKYKDGIYTYKTWEPIKKLQLSSKELKDHGLSNDSVDLLAA